MRISTLALCMLGLFAVPVPCWPDAPGPSQSEGFVERIASSDVVWEGMIVSADTSTWIPAPHCPSVSSPLPALDITIRPITVHTGTLEGDPVVLRAVQRMGALEDLRPGRRVLCWAYRECGDEWRLWGHYLIAEADGMIRPRYDLPRQLIERPDGRLLSFDDLVREVKSRSSAAPTAPFLAMSELVPVRVKTVTRQKRGVSVEATRLGERSEQSMSITFVPPREAVWQRPALGDTLLVPMKGQPVGPLRFDVAPTAFRVQYGYLRGLGVAFSARESAFAVEGDELRLRPLRRTPGSEGGSRR